MRRERQWWWRYDRMNKFFAQLVQCNTYRWLPTVTMVNTVCTCTCAKTCHQMMGWSHMMGQVYMMMYTMMEQHRKTDMASNQTVMKRYDLKPTGRHRLWPLTYHNTLFTRSGKDQEIEEFVQRGYDEVSLYAYLTVNLGCVHVCIEWNMHSYAVIGYLTSGYVVGRFQGRKGIKVRQATRLKRNERKAWIRKKERCQRCSKRTPLQARL